MSRFRRSRAFSLLLLLLPGRFRHRYGTDMEETFRARQALARSRGRVASIALWSRTGVDLARTALAERRRSSLTPAATPHSPRGEGPMSGWISDLRYAWRLVSRQRAQAAFVALTLAVGIGATTAVFSVVRGVVLRPLPYPDSDRLVAVWGRFLPESGFDFPQFPLSVPEYLDYRTATRAMQDVALFQTGSGTVGDAAGAPERVRLAAITPNTLSVLRVPVAQGRDFLAADGVPNAPRVVILSHGYWLRRFGGDPAVVGGSMRVSGTDRTIVGVAPAHFGFPSRDVEIWQPFVINPANPGNRQSHGQSAIARLADGATLAMAEAEMAALMAQWQAQFPTIHTGHHLFLRSMLDDVVGQASQILALLLAATAVLLLIVCANVSNILLARGEGRGREMAIRAALGAERRRLLRLTAFESLILAGAGGVMALGVAWAGIAALRALEGSGVPRVDDVSVDATVLLFASGVTVCTALLFGLVPALRGSIARPGAALRHDDRTSTADGSRLRVRRVLVAAEVALTVVLVVAAALMLQSLRRVLSVYPGFDPRGVVLANIDLPSASYRDHERVQQFYRDVLDRLRSRPDVTSATAASLVPVLRGSGVWDFEIAGRSAPAAGAPAWNAAVAVVRDGYFDALRIPVRRGRAITADDGPSQPPVAVVSEAFARKFLAGDDPIGQRLRVCCGDSRQWATIVGVAGDVRDQSLETAERPIYYLAHAQAPQTVSSTFASLAIVARTDRADAVGPALRQIVHERDPSLPLTVQQYSAQLAQSYTRRSFATTLFALFAGIGMLLGASGIYAVLAYGVARLTPEIGIRRALGATSANILRIVLRQGLVPAVAGLVLGIVTAVGLSRFLESQLFEVSALDPSIYGVVAAGVLGLAAAASLIPARRATRVSPLRALRDA